MGWLPGRRLPRRAGDVHPEPRPQTPGPLLPGIAAGTAGLASGTVRPRRGGGHRRTPRPGLRLVAAAHPPRRIAGQAARRPDARQLRGLGSARSRRAGSPSHSPGRAARPPRTGPCACSGARAPDAVNVRPICRGRLVRSIRGRRLGRRRRQAPVGPVHARQARLGQDQALSNGRLRRCRLSVAQERARHDGRLAAARPVR